MAYDSGRDYETELSRAFFERAIWQKLMNHVDALKTEDLMAMIDTEMMELYVEIVRILDDPALEDPECFHRVEALVRAFENRNYPVNRHDW